MVWFRTCIWILDTTSSSKKVTVKALYALAFPNYIWCYFQKIFSSINWSFVDKKKTENKGVHYLIDFTSHAIYSIGIRVIWIVVHLLAQDPWEFIVHCISKSCQRSTAICLDKSAMNIFQKCKGNPSCGRRGETLISYLLSKISQQRHIGNWWKRCS